MKVHFIQIAQPGDPTVLEWQSQDLPPPNTGEVQVLQKAVAVNFLDTYHRSGLYPVPLPSGIGVEAAGEVVAVGTGVSEFKSGDRVAYTSGPLGAYATARNIAAHHLVHLPAEIPYEHAAAIMVRGLTTHYLLRRVYPVRAGQTILVHAAAGGVGLLLCQWARALHATVIGTVSSDDKARLAKENGCTHPIAYEDFPATVKKLTAGKGVSVVYDGVGKATFTGSLDSLAPLGMMASFGNASGAVPPFELSELSRRGSLFITRPRLNDYIAERQDLLTMSREMFDLVKKGVLKVHIGQTFALKDAVAAHTALESRKTIGSTLLIP